MNNMEILKKEGLYKEGDSFFYGISTPKLWHYTVFKNLLGTFVGTTTFVITKNLENITIIPCNKITNKIILDKKIVIKNNEVSYFNVEKGGMGFYKISIIGQENCLFSFKISTNVNESIRENLDLLFDNFECKNREMIKKSNNFFVGLGLVILIGASIFALKDEKYLTALIMLVTLGWLISQMIKRKK